MTSPGSQLTASSLADFRSCPRKYQLRNIQCRRRITEGAALSFGRVIHAALAAWWTSGRDAAIGAMIDMAGDIEEDMVPKAAAMVRNYSPQLDGQPVSHRFRVASVELPFANLPIVNPRTGREMRNWQLAGKTDGVLQDLSDGSMWVLEHKTTSEDILGFGTYWQRLSIDSQIALYVLATGAAGVIYDVLRKPSIRFCKKDIDLDAFGERCSTDIAADPERYYQVRRVVYPRADLADVQADLWHQAHMLADCQRMNRWPRNSGACRGIYGTCEYLGVCTGVERIDDDSVFRSSVQHEELEVDHD